jgi:type VI secretion system protein VasG
MITENIKLLLNKFNSHCISQLDAAAGYAMVREHYEIGAEHFLFKLLEEGSGDIPILLQNADVRPEDLKSALLRSLDEYRTGNAGRPAFSQSLLDLVEQAWVVASLEFGAREVRSGHLLSALRTSAGRRAFSWLDEVWPGLSRERIAGWLTAGMEESVETPDEPGERTAGPSPEGAEALERFTENLTRKAREGKIDPVFAREKEIRQMTDILARRRKNNPILVGEPGTGKTAIVEGLALKIVEGEVPPAFQDADLLNLDLGLLQAGASVKGEFENRLKMVIQAIKEYPKPVITFIDEAHTLIGAGGSAGMGDAANLLKPALARGELRTVAATTWKEYKKYFEKDPALARRFQLVKLDEPDDLGAFAIMRGLKASYETHHGIRITDDAVTAAVRMARRYITGRHLPDVAIDLLDTAAARVALSQHGTPGEIQDMEQSVAALGRERDALRRDRSTSRNPEEIDERLAAIETEMGELNGRRDALLERWEREKGLVSDYVAALGGETAADEAAADPISEAGVRAAVEALREYQGKGPLMRAEVDAGIIASVISDWTGIPVGNMVEDEAERLLILREALRERIVGQNQALSAVSESLQVAKSGLKDPNKPLGVFMLMGPSGVGKTETALALADLLFGGPQYVTTINMSEFQEKHNVSRLIGSPPGYVGYGEGGVLTEAVRRKPYSVVLLDEVEKAHPDVMELFYQVFDKGVLSDGEGRVINFANTVILLTSNLGYQAIDQIAEGAPEGAMPLAEDVVEAIRPILSSHFQPALLARMTLVPYYPLSPEAIAQIVRMKLKTVETRLAEKGAAMQYGDAVINWIAAQCQVSETGARNVEHVIHTRLLPRLSVEILSSLGETDALKGKTLFIHIEDGGLRFVFLEKGEAPPVVETVEAESEGLGSGDGLEPGGDSEPDGGLESDEPEKTPEDAPEPEDKE